MGGARETGRHAAAYAAALCRPESDERGQLWKDFSQMGRDRGPALDWWAAWLVRRST